MRVGTIRPGVTRRAFAHLRIAPWYGVVVVSAAAFLLGWSMVWTPLHVPPDSRLVDFHVYWSAGESLLRGRPVYDYLTPLPNFLPFTYPPPAAIIAIPLALVPETFASVLWLVGSLAVLVWIVLVAFRPLLRRIPKAWRLVLVVPLLLGMGSLVPVLNCFHLGQVGIFLAALCLADCVVEHPRWPRGVLVGLAIAIKLTPGLFIIYFWLTGRKKAAVNAVVAFIVLAGAAALVAPQASWSYWTHDIFATGRVGDAKRVANQSLDGMFVRAFTEHAATVLFAVSVVALAVLGFRWARRAFAAGDDLAGVVIVGLMTVLVAPIAWAHHMAGWVPLAAGVVLGDGSSRRRWIAAAGLAVFYSLRVPWWSPDWFYDGAPVAIYNIGADSYGLVALIVVFVLGRSAALKTPQPAPTEPRQHVRS